MCDKKRKVSLIGIGTGGVKEMTERAKEEILASDCLIGASRMLESAACFLEQKKDIKRRYVKRISVGLYILLCKRA